MNERQSRISLKALLGLCTFAIIAITLIKHGWPNLNGQLLLGYLTFVGGTGFAIWNFNKTKQKEADARIFSEKAEVYEKLLLLIRDMLLSTKGWAEQKSLDQIAKELAYIRSDMIVWGGQDTIRATMLLETRPLSGDAEILETYPLWAVTKLYAAIRKDLGHDDDINLAADLMLSQVIEDERVMARAKLKRVQQHMSKRGMVKYLTT